VSDATVPPGRMVARMASESGSVAVCTLVTATWFVTSSGHSGPEYASVASTSCRARASPRGVIAAHSSL